MELRDYARAVAGRWGWVIVGGAVGVLLASAVGMQTSAAYEAQVTLYVDAAVIADEQDPSSAAEVRTAVLPSVAELATSSSVLAHVATTLKLDDSAGALAADLDVAVEREMSVLHIAATRATPTEAAAVARTVGAEVRRRAGELHTGTDGPQLRVTLVQNAAGPVPTVRPANVLALLGGLAGAGAAALAAGLAELSRPRVRGRSDVTRLTAAPVLGLLPAAGLPGGRRPRCWGRRSRHLPRREEELVRLRWSLRSASGDGRRVALVGAATDTAPLAAELAAPGLDVVPVDSPPIGTQGGPFDGAVVVVDGRVTTVGDLEATLGAFHAASVPITGVVIDGLLPPTGVRAQVRAGMRGDATWGLHGRSGAAVPAAAVRRTSVPAEVSGTQVAAGLAVAMVGYTRPLPMGLSAGLLVAAALLPVWLPAVRRYRGLTVLLTLAVVGLSSGALLAGWHSADHVFAPYEAASRASAVLGAIGGVGVLLWARSLLPVPVLGAVFGLGMLLSGLGDAPDTDNFWKFQLSAPLMVITLALADRVGRPAFTVAVLAVLGMVNVANDARSAFGFCAVAAVLVLWQQRRGRDRPVHRGRRWLALPVMGALATLGYWLLTDLMLAGALGAGIQQRTATQIAQSGSLLLGGRPEWTVTWALAHTHPLGFGLGTVPNDQDLLVAKAGIAVTNIPTAAGYVETYMLAGGVHLHSIVADLWASLGPAGVALGLAAGVLVLLGLADQLHHRQASGLVCLLVPTALWGLLFGPMESNVDTLTLALGLLLLVRPRCAPGAQVPPSGAAALFVPADAPQRPVVAR